MAASRPPNQMRSGHAIPTGPSLDQKMDALDAGGYQAIVAVFRSRSDELRTISLLENGARIAEFLEWLAEGEVDLDAPQSVGDPAETTPTGDQTFHAILAQMNAQGFEPFFLAFLDEREQAVSLVHPEIDDLEHFLRWLAAEVDQGETHDVWN